MNCNFFAPYCSKDVRHQDAIAVADKVILSTCLKKVLVQYNPLLLNTLSADAIQKTTNGTVKKTLGHQVMHEKSSERRLQNRSVLTLGSSFRLEHSRRAKYSGYSIKSQSQAIPSLHPCRLDRHESSAHVSI